MKKAFKTATGKVIGTAKSARVGLVGTFKAFVAKLHGNKVLRTYRVGDKVPKFDFSFTTPKGEVKVITALVEARLNDRVITDQELDELMKVAELK